MSAPRLGLKSGAVLRGQAGKTREERGKDRGRCLTRSAQRASGCARCGAQCNEQGAPCRMHRALPAFRGTRCCATRRPAADAGRDASDRRREIDPKGQCPGLRTSPFCRPRSHWEKASLSETGKKWERILHMAGQGCPEPGRATFSLGPADWIVEMFRTRQPAHFCNRTGSFVLEALNGSWCRCYT